MDFATQLEVWNTAAKKLAIVKNKYIVEASVTLAASTAKNAEQRKAEADVATSQLRLDVELAEVEERTAYHMMMFLRGAVLEAA